MKSVQYYSYSLFIVLVIRYEYFKFTSIEIINMGSIGSRKSYPVISNKKIDIL